MYAIWFQIQKAYMEFSRRKQTAATLVRRKRGQNREDKRRKGKSTQPAMHCLLVNPTPNLAMLQGSRRLARPLQIIIIII